MRRATRIVLMTGGGLTEGEIDLCGAKGIPILFKPFLAHDVISLIKAPVVRQMAAGAASASSAESKSTADPV